MGTSKTGFVAVKAGSVTPEAGPVTPEAGSVTPDAEPVLPPYPGRPHRTNSSVPSLPDLPPGTDAHVYCKGDWEKTRDARRNFFLEFTLFEPQVLKQVQHLRYLVRSLYALAAADLLA